TPCSAAHGPGQSPTTISPRESPPHSPVDGPILRRLARPYRADWPPHTSVPSGHGQPASDSSSPTAVGGVGTREPTPQRATARMARKAPRVEPPPYAGDTELGALFHTDHQRYAQVAQQRQQRYSSASTIRRHTDPTAPSFRMTRVTARRMTATA